MPKCAVVNCPSHCEQSRSIIYHPLPENDIMRREWIAVCNIRRRNLRSVRVCSLHFRDSDYENEMESGMRRNSSKLKEDSVPTIFSLEDCIPSDVAHNRTQKREIRSYLLATQRRMSVQTGLNRFSHPDSDFLTSRMYNALFSPVSHEKSYEKIFKLKESVKKLKKRNAKLSSKCTYWKEVSAAKSAIIRSLMIEKQRLLLQVALQDDDDE